MLLGQSNFGLGVAYHYLHINDSAIRYYEEAKPLLTAKRDSFNLLGLQQNIAWLFRDTTRISDLENYYDVLLSKKYEQGDLKGVSALRYNVGLLHLGAENYYSAEKYFKQSKEVSKANEFKYDHAKALKGLALVEKGKNKYQKALSYWISYDSIMTSNFFAEDHIDKILKLQEEFKTAEIERENEIKQAEIDQNKRQIVL